MKPANTTSTTTATTTKTARSRARARARPRAFLFLTPLLLCAALSANDAPAPASSPTPAPPVTIKLGGDEQWISVGGFMQGQAEAGDAVDSRFSAPAANDRIYLRRARIVLGGHFAENFDFKISAEMAGSLGGKNNMTAALKDGFVSWAKYPALNIAIGQFKAGFGYEFLAPSTALPVVERALVTDMLTLNRQSGAQVSGTLAGARLNYALGIFNGNGPNSSANDNNQFLHTARVSLAPLKTKIAATGWDAAWSIGLDACRSNDLAITLPDGLANPAFPGPGRRAGLGIDTQLTAGPCQLWFEYLGTQFTPAATTATAAPAAPAPAKVTANGWYLLGEYTIVPKKWQAIVRYDTFNPDTALTGAATDTWTLGVNYLIKGDSLKLMLDCMTATPGHTGAPPARASRVLLRAQAIF